MWTLELVKSLFWPFENQKISLKNISHNPNQKYSVKTLHAWKVNSIFCQIYIMCKKTHGGKFLFLLLYRKCLRCHKVIIKILKDFLNQHTHFFVKNNLTLHLNGCHSAKAKLIGFAFWQIHIWRNTKQQNATLLWKP